MWGYWNGMNERANRLMNEWMSECGEKEEKIIVAKLSVLFSHLIINFIK